MSKSYNKWLKTAYLLFAKNGPENFSIRALAEACQLPRTNFYYHFDDKDDLIDKIIEVHFTTTTELFNEPLRTRFHMYIPDLYVILFDFNVNQMIVCVGSTTIINAHDDSNNRFGHTME